MLVAQARLLSPCLKRCDADSVISELSRPLPEDFDLFSGVDFALGEIQRCYINLERFWLEEIYRAVKTRKTRRVDPDDIKRWRTFKTSLEQTIESWKVYIYAFCLYREQM